jgi:hypothetical protein
MTRDRRVRRVELACVARPTATSTRAFACVRPPAPPWAKSLTTAPAERFSLGMPGPCGFPSRASAALVSARCRPAPPVGPDPRSLPNRAPSACSLRASTWVEARSAAISSWCSHWTDPAVDLDVRGVATLPIGHPGWCLDRRRETAVLCLPHEGLLRTSPSRGWWPTSGNGT